MLGISEGHEDESDPVSVFRELWEEDIKNSQFAIEREELLGVTVISLKVSYHNPFFSIPNYGFFEDGKTCFSCKAQSCIHLDFHTENIRPSHHLLF